MGFLIMFIIFLGLDLYVFQGIKMLTAGISSGLLKNGITIGFWIISWGLVLLMIYGFFGFRKTHHFTWVSRWTLNFFITIFVTKIFFIFFLFSEDIYRFVFGVGQKIVQQNPAEDQAFFPDRRLFFSQVGLMVASVPFVSFLYWMTKGKYKYKIHHHKLFFDDLPSAFEGFKIAQFSDFHSGSFDDPQEVQKGLNMLQNQNCDLIVFTGDLVNNSADEVDPYKHMLKELHATYGKFSILGNHDYGDYIEWPSQNEKQNNLQQLINNHHDMGFRLLQDESHAIEKKGEKIHILGVENWGVGFGKSGNLEKALVGTQPNDFKVLLSHDPTHWEHEVKMHPSNVHLTLSGHTHGAQMGVEIPGFKFSPVQFRYPHWAGLKEELGRIIHINRGFGFLAFAGRVGIWPEITVIELLKKQV